VRHRRLGSGITASYLTLAHIARHECRPRNNQYTKQRCDQYLLRLSQSKELRTTITVQFNLATFMLPVSLEYHIFVID